MGKNIVVQKKQLTGEVIFSINGCTHEPFTGLPSVKECVRVFSMSIKNLDARRATLDINLCRGKDEPCKKQNGCGEKDPHETAMGIIRVFYTSVSTKIRTEVTVLI